LWKKQRRHLIFSNLLVFIHFYSAHLLEGNDDTGEAEEELEGVDFEKLE